jgi:hypothetical protein
MLLSGSIASYRAKYFDGQCDGKIEIAWREFHIFQVIASAENN